MLELAARKNAMLFLFIVAFVESSFFPIPPDIMLIPMVLATPAKAYRIAGLATVASVLGGYFGYLIGVFGYDLIAKPILTFYGYMSQFDVFKGYYHEWGAWIVFGAGLTPFPYKVVTIASGVVHLDLLVFTVASVLARGGRFFLVAFDIDLIADHDPDSEFAHFSRGVSQNLNPVFQFNAKHRIGKFFDNFSGQFKKFFFTHKIFLIC